MIASLGMYDRPETAAANDRLWRLIRDGMRAKSILAPEFLTRGPDAYWPAWSSPDLVFSQTCGFPYRSRLHQHVSLVGTPDYGVEGCAAGYYCSVVVVRDDDPRTNLAALENARFAYNDEMSQSGWAALHNQAATLGLNFSDGICTGGHRLSALAVLESRADFACLDAVTWKMLTRWDPFAQNLRVIERTMPTPGLPFITRPGHDPETVFQIVANAVVQMAEDDRSILQLKGIVRLASADYLAIPIPVMPK